MSEPPSTTDHPIGAPGDFPDGVGVAVSVVGLDLVVVRDGDAFHALTNRCPHKGARFALDGPGEAPAARPARCRLTDDGDARTVACPWHGLPFDVETGACPVPRFGLGTFEVVVEGDVVSVRL